MVQDSAAVLPTITVEVVGAPKHPGVVVHKGTLAGVIARISGVAVG